MAPQVTRLALCFSVLVAGYLVLRSQTVPEDFGKEGFHRFQAPALLAGNDLVHAGKEACADCHPGVAEATPHVRAGLSCESCHGPAKAHTEDYEKVKPRVPSTRDDCARCHASGTGRRKDFPQVDVKVHNPDSACMDCHVVHATEAANE